MKKIADGFVTENKEVYWRHGKTINTSEEFIRATVNNASAPKENVRIKFQNAAGKMQRKWIPGKHLYLQIPEA